mgnify:CR=1 FL=1
MAENILETIAAKRRIYIEEKKKQVPLKNLISQAEALLQKEEAGEVSAKPSFYDSLAGDKLSFICEVKKASPSKGLIASEFPYLMIAQEYESAGAAAISVLTEPEYFLGRDEYLKEIAKTVNIPVLRKDFTIDEYQIYEAKLLGASAVLLICSLLDKKTLSKFLDLASELKLDALVEEVHTALECGAKIIGVNNRNLKNFTVDVKNSLRLRALVPKDVVFVSESGIKTREDTRQLAAYHVNAVLIGETLMRSPDKKTALDLLRP